MSTSQALDNALAPVYLGAIKVNSHFFSQMFSGIGGLVNGLVGTQGTTSVIIMTLYLATTSIQPPFVLTKPPSPKSA